MKFFVLVLCSVFAFGSGDDSNGRRIVRQGYGYGGGQSSHKKPEIITIQIQPYRHGSGPVNFGSNGHSARPGHLHGGNGHGKQPVPQNYGGSGYSKGPVLGNSGHGGGGYNNGPMLGNSGHGGGGYNNGPATGNSGYGGGYSQGSLSGNSGIGGNGYSKEPVIGNPGNIGTGGGGYGNSAGGYGNSPVLDTGNLYESAPIGSSGGTGYGKQPEVVGTIPLVTNSGYGGNGYQEPLKPILTQTGGGGYGSNIGVGKQPELLEPVLLDQGYKNEFGGGNTGGYEKPVETIGGGGYSGGYGR